MISLRRQSPDRTWGSKGICQSTRRGSAGSESDVECWRILGRTAILEMRFAGCGSDLMADVAPCTLVVHTHVTNDVALKLDETFDWDVPCLSEADSPSSASEIRIADKADKCLASSNSLGIIPSRRAYLISGVPHGYIELWDHEIELGRGLHEPFVPCFSPNSASSSPKLGTSNPELLSSIFTEPFPSLGRSFLPCKVGQRHDG